MPRCARQKAWGGRWARPNGWRIWRRGSAARSRRRSAGRRGRLRLEPELCGPPWIPAFAGMTKGGRLMDCGDARAVALARRRLFLAGLGVCRWPTPGPSRKREGRRKAPVFRALCCRLSVCVLRRNGAERDHPRVFRRRLSQLMSPVQPPSTGSDTPLMKDAASEARKVIASATSSGWAKRAIGTRFTISLSS